MWSRLIGPCIVASPHLAHDLDVFVGEGFVQGLTGGSRSEETTMVVVRRDALSWCDVWLEMGGRGWN